MVDQTTAPTGPKGHELALQHSLSQGSGDKEQGLLAQFSSKHGVLEKFSSPGLGAQGNTHGVAGQRRPGTACKVTEALQFSGVWDQVMQIVGELPQGVQVYNNGPMHVSSMSDGGGHAAHYASTSTRNSGWSHDV